MQGLQRFSQLKFPLSPWILWDAPLILLVPASVVESHFMIQLDEHQRQGRTAQYLRQVADMTVGVRLRTLVIAQGDVARSHLDPVSVHRLDEPAPRPLHRRILMPLSDPSLRGLSDLDVSWCVWQLFNEDRFRPLTEEERAEIPELALALMGRSSAINPDVPVAIRLHYTRSRPLLR